MQRPRMPQCLSARLVACARLQAGPLQGFAGPDGGLGGGTRRQQVGRQQRCGPQSGGRFRDSAWAPPSEAQVRGRAMSISFNGAGSFFRSWVLSASTLGSMAVCSLIFVTHASAQVATLRPPQGGEVRALVIGIDAYQFVPQLRGAVADARDIESTLRRPGARVSAARDDASAGRATVMRTLDQLVKRSQAGDLVVLSIAGHRVQEPGPIKGSHADCLDNG